MQIDLNKPNHLMAVVGAGMGAVGAVALGFLFHACLRSNPFATAAASLTGGLLFSSTTILACQMQRELSEPDRK